MTESHHNINSPLLLNVSSDPQKPLTSDEALKTCGDSNWYQIRTTIILALQSTVIAFILQGQPFLFLPPKFQCHRENGEVYLCEENDGCKEPNPQIDPDAPNSLVVHFGLYCDREYLKALTQTVFFVISNVSTLIFSFLADYKGRKITILILYCIGSLPLIIAAFAVNWTMFMVFLITAGIGVNPFSALCFVLLSESAGEKYRQISSIALLVTWGVGELIFVPIAYYFPDWKILLLYWIAIPLTVQIFSYVWIYESPKFLIMKKQFEEAKKVFLKIAKVNKKPVVDLVLAEEENLKTQREGFESLLVENLDQDNLLSPHRLSQNKKILKEKKKIYTYYDLFRYPSQLKITLILCVAYFGIYLTYYGGIFALDTVGSNIYISAVVTNCSELTAYLCSNPVVRFCKRKISFPLCFLATAVCCMMFLTTTDPLVYMILATITKFFVSVGFSIVFIYTAELYPTTVRSLGIGLTTFVGKFGCALAPILISEFRYNLNIHPMVSFGIFSIFAGITVCFLKETFKVDLEDEIPEEKKQKEKQRESAKIEKVEEVQEDYKSKEKTSSGEENEDHNFSPNRDNYNVPTTESIPKTQKKYSE